MNCKTYYHGLRFIDLFAGIGGFHIALKSLGAECVFASEVDRSAAATYEENHGLKPAGDITKIAAEDIPQHDVLCAGFPCQPFSRAGRQRGLEDERGQLFFEITRIAEHHKPRIILLENVKDLETHDGGRTFDVIRTSLASLGYHVRSKVLNSVDFGVAQARERIFIVCIREDISDGSMSWPLPYIARFAVDELDEPISYEPCEHKTPSATYVPTYNPTAAELARMPRSPVRVGKFGNGTQGYRVYSAQGPAVTLCSSGGGAGACTGLYLVDDVARALTPRECARVSGFPDDFKLPKSRKAAFRQFGNTVVVSVARSVAESIAQSIDHYHWFLDYKAKRAEVLASITPARRAEMRAIRMRNGWPLPEAA